MLLQSSFLRFLLAGAVNTLGTLAIYVVLVGSLSPMLAWAIAFGTGIAFVNIVYPRFVFRTRSTIAGLAGNTVFYMVSFVASEALLSAIIRWIGAEPRVAGAVVAAMMVPINYAAARLFFPRPVDASASSGQGSGQQ